MTRLGYPKNRDGAYHEELGFRAAHGLARFAIWNRPSRIPVYWGDPAHNILVDLFLDLRNWPESVPESFCVTPASITGGTCNAVNMGHWVRRMIRNLKTQPYEESRDEQVLKNDSP
ncbi:hypothetical protein ACJ72_08393 [Emergomyces africanus]|uniref:Uncharacterized protein n=1 Tax=Emergomyces africanus TaxID=1955775 RepID=A0A1B7NL52_9EURO|nr:hypothetical protein ACJ72_08393 [Emergomyces africanus]